MGPDETVPKPRKKPVKRVIIYLSSTDSNCSYEDNGPPSPEILPPVKDEPMNISNPVSPALTDSPLPSPVASVSTSPRYWFSVPISPSVTDLSPLRSRYNPETQTYTRVTRGPAPTQLFAPVLPAPTLPDASEGDSQSDHGTMVEEEFARYVLLARTLSRRVMQFPWLVRENDNVRK